MRAIHRQRTTTWILAVGLVVAGSVTSTSSSLAAPPRVTQPRHQPIHQQQHCGWNLIRAGQWLHGAGVAVRSNGPDEGTNRPCGQGSKWLSSELITRLYKAREWTNPSTPNFDTWSGAGGDSHPTVHDSMYYSAPNDLTELSQSQGRITYLNPGDAVFVNRYLRGHFVPGGLAFVVASAHRVNAGSVLLVSQDGGSPTVARPWSTALLGAGRITFPYVTGSATQYRVIGVVHSPAGLPDLSGVRQLVGTSGSCTFGCGGAYCALLSAGTVDCWGGYVQTDELGQGRRVDATALPAPVVSTSGSGRLTGVTRLTAGADSFCALLIAGTVDCWGDAARGELGNGSMTGSPTPVRVVSPSGTGLLTGVARVKSMGLHTSDFGGGYCAILSAGTVDCWGDGLDGALGDGSQRSSAVPVQVVGTDGTGALTGVVGLSDTCALLDTGAVDCWGVDPGNGSYDSSIPVQPVTTNGTGTLTGVVAMSYADFNRCALLSSGAVDCWGDGAYGELGNGVFYQNYSDGSLLPVSVVATSGTGMLTGVARVEPGVNGYCAILVTSAVDCWGFAGDGDLGNGIFPGDSTLGSAIPVAVVGTTGTGTLSGAVSLTSRYDGWCAVLAAGTVDCWGDGIEGELGNGHYYLGPVGSAIPVDVIAPIGFGLLTGVTSLATDGGGSCALRATSEVDCWGVGDQGELGGGTFYDEDEQSGSADPIPVVSPPA